MQLKNPDQYFPSEFPIYSYTIDKSFFGNKHLINSIYLDVWLRSSSLKVCIAPIPVSSSVSRTDPDFLCMASNHFPCEKFYHSWFCSWWDDLYMIVKTINLLLLSFVWPPFHYRFIASACYHWFLILTHLSMCRHLFLFGNAQISHLIVLSYVHRFDRLPCQISSGLSNCFLSSATVSS